MTSAGKKGGGGVSEKLTKVDMGKGGGGSLTKLISTMYSKGLGERKAKARKTIIEVWTTFPWTRM